MCKRGHDAHYRNASGQCRLCNREHAAKYRAKNIAARKLVEQLQVQLAASAPVVQAGSASTPRVMA